MDLTCTFECRTVSLSFVSYVSHGKTASDGGGKTIIESPFPRWDGDYFFVVSLLLPAIIFI